MSDKAASVSVVYRRVGGDERVLVLVRTEAGMRDSILTCDGPVTVFREVDAGGAKVFAEERTGPMQWSQLRLLGEIALGLWERE